MHELSSFAVCVFLEKFGRICGRRDRCYLIVGRGILRAINVTKASAAIPTIFDDEEEIKTYTCADCAQTLEFPASSTNLVSMEYGWRLVREPDATGTPVAIWRCPSCWTARKDKLAISSEHPVPSSRPASQIRKK